jgi:hypothetical protein
LVGVDVFTMEYVTNATDAGVAAVVLAISAPLN